MVSCLYAIFAAQSAAAPVQPPPRYLHLDAGILLRDKEPEWSAFSKILYAKTKEEFEVETMTQGCKWWSPGDDRQIVIYQESLYPLSQYEQYLVFLDKLSKALEDPFQPVPIGDLLRAQPEVANQIRQGLGVEFDEMDYDSINASLQREYEVEFSAGIQQPVKVLILRTVGPVGSPTTVSNFKRSTTGTGADRKSRQDQVLLQVQTKALAGDLRNSKNMELQAAFQVYMNSNLRNLKESIDSALKRINTSQYALAGAPLSFQSKEGKGLRSFPEPLRSQMSEILNGFVRPWKLNDVNDIRITSVLPTISLGVTVEIPQPAGSPGRMYNTIRLNLGNPVK